MKDQMVERWVTWKDRKVGFILPYDNVLDREEKVYITERKRPFLFKGRDGFSISTSILKILKREDVKSIRIKLNKKNGGTAVYGTTLERWLREGEENWYELRDRQLFIPLDKFELRGE